MQKQQQIAQQKLNETDQLALEAKAKLDDMKKQYDKLEGQKANLDFEKDKILRENLALKEMVQKIRKQQQMQEKHEEK